MKTVLIILSIVCLIYSTIHAETTNSTDHQEKCEQISKLAESIMTARQNNIKMSEVIKVFDDTPQLKELVIMAYEQPRMSVEENQISIINDFQNTVYLQCIKYDPNK